MGLIEDMSEEFSERLTSFENKWQKTWESENLYSATDQAGEKYYVLEMFPYPSGNLHMGHVRNFSLGDAPARMKRMQGYDVMHPIGWDAFGLPAENAAIERDLDPEEWTRDCIDNMKSQLKNLGLSYDWEREVATCDPEYYKWNQWIFLQMLDQGLAYQDSSNVNWCPSCETVLADEQVENGNCWRCDTEAQQKEMEQWFLEITQYADELLEDLDKLEGWPDKVTKMQEEWIGKSEGAEIEFEMAESDTKVEVFTTRPDTIYGATFLALAPEHSLAAEIGEEKTSVEQYRQEALDRRSDNANEDTRAGVFTGRYAVNPATGEEIPVYVAEFVLTEYGTGAIMSVPAHDQRDYEFAAEHDIPVKEVVETPENHSFEEDGAYEEEGKHIRSESLNGLENDEAISESINMLESQEAGSQGTSYKLRDWLISRQRYWGTPIPVVHCDKCGAVPVPEEDLPVELPEDVEFTETGNPIETSDSWMKADCPECGAEAERETDTMDTFIGSSWYYLRYISPKLEDAPFSQEDADYWMNVDQYIGGVEHAVMHLLYARFFQKFLRDQGMLENDEPFERLLTLGMVNHPAYKCPNHGWIYPEQVEEDDTCGECGSSLQVETRSMSKSKHNVVDPTELVEEHGADTARVFMLRSAGPTKELDWSSEGVEAAENMLENVESIVESYEDQISTSSQPEMQEPGLSDRIVASRIQRAIQTVTQETEDYGFNLALDEIDNLLTKLNWYHQNNPDTGIMCHGIKTLIKLISPYAPHLAEEMWDRTHSEDLILETEWPQPRQELIDPEAEKIDSYFDRTASDIREISDVTDKDPENIKMIRAAPWKYQSSEAILAKLSETTDISQIMSHVMREDLKQHAGVVKQQVKQAAENPVKYRQNYVGKSLEEEALRSNKHRIEQEFDANVTIEHEDESSEERAQRARPGKPAIVLY
jgi:leucyl-tRNA synthetase